MNAVDTPVVLRQADAINVARRARRAAAPFTSRKKRGDLFIFEQRNKIFHAILY
jgi:hypothetical protein